MQMFENQEFHRLHDRDSGRLFADMEFTQCQFRSCFISRGYDPNLRSTARNMRFLRCEEKACTIGRAILEDILVDGLKTHGRFDTWGAVFKHVTLKGRIGNLKISDFIVAADASPALRHKINLRFQAANAEYYRNVDWALDISQAEFEECELRGVPGHLVRRDPETQVLLKREKVLAMRSEWQRLDLSKTHWPVALSDLLADERIVSEVLVAPKRDPRFKELLNGLNLLRRAGVAEPD